MANVYMGGSNKNGGPLLDFFMENNVLGCILLTPGGLGTPTAYMCTCRILQGQRLIFPRTSHATTFFAVFSVSSTAATEGLWCNAQPRAYPCSKCGLMLLIDSLLSKIRVGAVAGNITGYELRISTGMRPTTAVLTCSRSFYGALWVQHCPRKLQCSWSSYSQYYVTLLTLV